MMLGRGVWMVAKSCWREEMLERVRDGRGYSFYLVSFQGITVQFEDFLGHSLI